MRSHAAGRELTLGALVLIALALWIFAGAWVNATTVVLLVISLMLVTGVATWDDIVSNTAAWNTLAEREAIGEFYGEVLAVLGSKLELFQQYPDATGLVYWLRLEAVRRQLMEGLRLSRQTPRERG